MNTWKTPNMTVSPFISEDLMGCPVCEGSLLGHPLPKPDIIQGSGKDATAMRNEIREMRSGKMRDNEMIVAAACGHIFHRFCLRHYCFVNQQTRNSAHVKCPTCHQELLSMVQYQIIDYRAHVNKNSHKLDNLYQNGVAMNIELQEARSEALQILVDTEQKIVETTEEWEEARARRKRIAEEGARLKDAEGERSILRQKIDNCDKQIDSMHKENLNIVKMYLTVMKDQSKEFLRDKHIPEPLIPYLAVILGNEELLKKFGEIIRPVELDGLKSNAELLIKEILADGKHVISVMGMGLPPNFSTYSTRMPTVGAKSGQLTSKRKKHYDGNAKQPKPVVVKVQRSTVSIFSRASLDQESLKTIFNEVKAPIHRLKEAQKTIGPNNKICKRKKGQNTKSSARSSTRSVSEIQVLMEPRRKCHAEHSPSAPAARASSIDVVVPPRRCKSTEPVLMKTKRKKMPTLGKEQLELCAVGDGHTSKLEHDASKDGKKPDPGTKIKGTGELEGKDMVKGQGEVCGDLPSSESSTSNPRPPLQPFGSRVSQLSQSTSVDGNMIRSFGIQRRASTAGFIPGESSGSIFETIYEDVPEPSHSMVNLVDDVSKITFSSVRRIPPSNQEKPLMEYSVSTTAKVTTSTNTDNMNYEPHRQPHNSFEKERIEAEDIEGSLKLSELRPSCPSFSSGSNSNRSGCTIQGILPGPYLAPPEKSWGQIPYPPPSLPIYQSKWLTRLPSKRAYTGETQIIFDCHQPHQRTMNSFNSPHRQVSWSSTAPGMGIHGGINYTNDMQHTVVNIPSAISMFNPMNGQMYSPAPPPLQGYHHGFSHSQHLPMTQSRLPPLEQNSSFRLNNNNSPSSQTYPSSTKVSFMENALKDVCRDVSPPGLPQLPSEDNNWTHHPVRTSPSVSPRAIRHAKRRYKNAE